VRASMLNMWLACWCIFQAVDRTAVELKQELESANRQYNQNLLRLRQELQAEVEMGHKIEVETCELRELITATRAEMSARDNSVQDGENLRSKQLEVQKLNDPLT
jgi:hypothetical protein